MKRSFRMRNDNVGSGKELGYRTSFISPLKKSYLFNDTYEKVCTTPFCLHDDLLGTHFRNAIRAHFRNAMDLARAAPLYIHVCKPCLMLPHIKHRNHNHYMHMLRLCTITTCAYAIMHMHMLQMVHRRLRRSRIPCWVVRACIC